VATWYGSARLKGLAARLTEGRSPVKAQPDAAFSWTRFAALFLFLCVLFVLRKPDTLLNPQFWAEDGRLLFHDQLVEGGLAPVVHAYRGYLIVNTRLVAAFAALFPVVYAPLIYNLAAILIAALGCSLFALPWYRHLVHADSLRVVLCVAVAGALSTESLAGNLTNSQWYLALAALVLLVRETSPSEPLPIWQTILCALTGLLAALTNPVLVVTAPICLWRLVRKRNRAVAAAILAGVIVQVVRFSLEPAGTTPPVPRGVAQIDHLAAAAVIATVYRVVLSSIAGSKVAEFFSVAGAVGAFLCTLIAAVAWLVWLCLSLDRGKRLQAGVAVYIATASVLLALGARGGLSDGFATVTHIIERGEQYFFIAGCLLLFLVAVSIEYALRSRREHVQAVVLLVAVAGGFAGNFAVPSFLDLHWRQGAARIDAWRIARAKNALVGDVTVLQNPEDWAIRLPATYPELTITGFPDRVLATPGGDAAAAFRIQGAAIGRSADSTYVDLPTILAIHAIYRVRAVVETRGGATVSLWVHGMLAGNSRVETAPLNITGPNSVLETQVMTDDTQRLCIHIRRHAGDPATFQSIAITRL